MSKVANWDTAPITGRASGAANLFNRTIPNELIRLMRLNPGKYYRLLDENGKPAEFTKRDVGTLMGAAKPFHIISRQIDGDKERRVVWIGYDPAHTEALKKAREARKAKK